MADDWNFNYAHFACEYCKQRGGLIHRFNQTGGAVFAHENCYNEYQTRMATERIRASRDAKLETVPEEKTPKSP
jgi:hypothetical protein